MLTFKVVENVQLLPFIMERMYGISRNKAKALIVNRVVLEDNTITTFPLTELRPGQVVQIDRSKHKMSFHSNDIDIVYEDPYLLVVDKRAGLLSMSNNTRQLTAQQVLNRYLEKGGGRSTSHIVHRLDRDTSGVVILAKNEETQKSKKIEETVTVQGETRKPAEIFLEVNAYLSQGKYSKAYELLEDYNPNYAEKFYKEYFLALTYKADMNYDEAIRHFSIAETICPNFWLAYFNHGFLLKEQEKEIAAKRCFEKCMTYIESYIDSKNTNFDFLSEEFSAEYFYSLCKKYVLGGDEK